MTALRSLLTRSRDQFPTTLAYFAAFVALGLVSASLGPTLTGLSEQTRSSLNEVAYLFTARSLGYLVGAFSGGRLYDRLPGHPLMAATIVGLSLCMVVTPLVPLLPVLAAVLFAIGVCEGGLDVGGNTLLVWLHRENVAPFMNALHFFYGVGALVSPIIVAQALAATGGIKWAYWLLAICVVPVALSIARFPSPAHAETSEHVVADRRDGVFVALVAVFFFLYVGVEVGFAGWIYTYAFALGLADEAGAAYLTSAFWAAFTLGRLVAIPLGARIPPRVVLFGDLAACLVALVAILRWSSSEAVLWGGTFLVGLALASVFPTTINLAERRITFRGRVTAWFFVGATTGAMFFPWLIGQFFESVGPSVTMRILILDAALAVGVFGLLMARSKRPAPFVEQST